MDTLNEKIEGLVKKAEKSGMPYSILKKVYDRGMAAWKTGHRPGTTPQQWAFARVNSFVTKSSGTWGKADADLAKQVRGEEVERRTTAKSMLGQVREKLGKDADAGDYVKDFRKSDAPQFKGKSDKKKQKMAIAAYLDSKEEVKEENLQEATVDPKSAKIILRLLAGMEGPIKIPKLLSYDMKYHISKFDSDYIKSKGGKPVRGSASRSGGQLEDLFRALGIKDLYLDGQDVVIGSKSIGKFKDRKTTVADLVKMTKVKVEEVDIQESGHTDVPSMKTQVQIAMDALQKMNTELGKLSDEEELPTWWTNKVATAVGKLDGMADYIDAKSDQGQKMNESNLTEEKVFVVRFEKEGMRFAVPFRDMKMAKDGEKILKKSAGVSNLSITQDILKPGIKLSRTQEGKIVKESKMGELFLDMQMDAQEMSERDFIKTYSKQGFQAAELKRMHKEFNEEVEKVDNSLMAQATRVISHTSIREKIDPADIDNIATADDRKAADKNIIIQLRRAQDMQGKADVTFKDKPNKKEKLDIRVINKALDMFDKMKPNDKAKMQTTIGKSYRDLLKTVQRGRI